MRVAIAGLGSAAIRGHLPALSSLAADELVEVVGVCDPKAQRHVTAAGLTAGSPVFTDVETMLDTVVPELLVVATHPAAHVDLTLAGLRRGVDVVCEKPVTVTNQEQRALADAKANHPSGVVVPLHQYVYSVGWHQLEALGRAAIRAPDTFRLTVRVERPGTDPHAASSWRSDPASGGGLADHGVHYLALARTLGAEMTTLHAGRAFDHLGRERVTATVQIGNGTLELDIDYRAGRRRTTVLMETNSARMRWQGNRLTSENSGTFRRRIVPALSDRAYVDGLYLDLYTDLLRHRSQSEWRAARWDDVLTLGAVLADLQAVLGVAQR